MIIDICKYVEATLHMPTQHLLWEEKTPPNFILQWSGSWIFESNHLPLLNPKLPPFLPVPSVHPTRDVLHVNLKRFIDRNALDYWWTLFFAVGDHLLPCRCFRGAPLFGVRGEQRESVVFIKMDHTAKNQPLPHSCGYWFFPFLLHWAYHKRVHQQLHLWYSDSLPEMMKCPLNCVCFLLPSDKNKMYCLHSLQPLKAHVHKEKLISSLFLPQKDILAVSPLQ